VVAALCLASCKGGGGGSENAAVSTIGGSVIGLHGTGLVLENNGGDPLSVSANGSFIFATPVRLGVSYSVRVRTQPTASPPEMCSVTNGNGTIVGGAVTNIKVGCHPPTGKFLYTGNVGNTVSGFSIDPDTGALTELAGSPFRIDGYPVEDYPYRGLYVGSRDKFLFVAGKVATSSSFQYSLTGYTIDAVTGVLSQIPGTPITSPSSFTRAFFHPNARVLYLPVYNEGIRAYSIDPAIGVLTPVLGQPYRLPGDFYPARGDFDPSGSTLFVGSGLSDPTLQTRVHAFAVDATTGALTLLRTVDYSGPLGDVLVHSSGKYAYMWYTGRVALIGIDNPASLTVADAAPFPPVVSTGSISVGALLEGSGRYVDFAYNYQSPAGGRPGYVVAYRIDTASGALTLLAGSPNRINGGGIVNVVLDTTRRYVVATSLFPATMNVLEHDSATGGLEHVPGSPFAPTVGTTPIGITFEPSGRFAYLPDVTTSSVSAYSFDAASGRLDFIGSYPVGANPSTLAQIAGLQ
jgi:6-phosphogluconolactonase